MEAIRSSETSVLTRATLCNIPEDGILKSFLLHTLFNTDTQRRGRLRRCDTSREAESLTSNEVMEFFKLTNPSSRTLVLGSTQLLTQMSTRDLPVGKGRPMHKADNLTSSCERTV
jgi:hypothetical protein